MWEETGMKNSFNEPQLSDTMLLGSPLLYEGLDSGLRTHVAVFKKVSEKLNLSTSHESYFLYRSCPAMRRWLIFFVHQPVPHHHY